MRHSFDLNKWDMISEDFLQLSAVCVYGRHSLRTAQNRMKEPCMCSAGITIEWRLGVFILVCQMYEPSTIAFIVWYEKGLPSQQISTVWSLSPDEYSKAMHWIARCNEQSQVGDENMFIFGARSHEVAELRQQRVGYPVDPRFTAALDMIRNGYFGWAEFFAPIVKGVDGLSPGSDFYLLGPDFAGYIEAQEMVCPRAWIPLSFNCADWMYTVELHPFFCWMKTCPMTWYKKLCSVPGLSLSIRNCEQFFICSKLYFLSQYALATCISLCYTFSANKYLLSTYIIVHESSNGNLCTELFHALVFLLTNARECFESNKCVRSTDPWKAVGTSSVGWTEISLLLRFVSVQMNVCNGWFWQVDQTYQDKKKWTKMSILSTAGSGKFSSDRTIQEYANEIWKVKPCKVPDE